MALTANIVGLQSVLVLCIADVSIHVLIEDVFKAADLGRRKSQSEMQESILEGLCGDASGICFVANAEKCFWSQILGFQLRYKFVQNDLFGIRFLGWPPLSDLLLTRFGQLLYKEAGWVSLEITLDLDDRRDRVFNAIELSLWFRVFSSLAGWGRFGLHFCNFCLLFIYTIQI